MIVGHLTPSPQGGFDRFANIGGPMSRTRTERIHSSLLGRDDSLIRCPRVIRLGLSFWRNANPVSAMNRILEDSGYANPEELRDQFALPSGRLICRDLVDPSLRLPVRDSAPEIVLEQALLLGLCTAVLFDPSRPVLWTEASLKRGLELFDPAGFYA
jgi:hypothetical protein